LSYRRAPTLKEQGGLFSLTSEFTCTCCDSVTLQLSIRYTN
jgi:hypothetical protein